MIWTAALLELQYLHQANETLQPTASQLILLTSPIATGLPQRPSGSLLFHKALTYDCKSISSVLASHSVTVSFCRLGFRHLHLFWSLWVSHEVCRGCCARFCCPLAWFQLWFPFQRCTSPVLSASGLETNSHHSILIAQRSCASSVKTNSP